MVWCILLKNVAVIYPNKYKAGITCLAVHILANHLSKYYNTKVFFLENYQQIKNFDTIFITLQYELDYFNAINIVKFLKMQNPNAKFIAGGPCVMENPYPLMDFFDAFIVGEIEGSNVMYEVVEGNYDVEGVLTKYKDKVKRIYPKKLGIEDYPIYQPIPENSAYGKTFLLELGRGCPRRCKFCLARAIYYPPRIRKLDDLIYLAEEGIKTNKVNKVSLIHPSVGDYKYILDLVEYLVNKGVQVSLSSIRVDTLTEEFLKLTKPKTLTIAPEAGSEKLREIIKKDISEEDIFRGVELAKKYNISKIKLYYMVGLPNEEWEDIEAIINQVKEIKRHIKMVEVSVNPFIPKPHTDFELESFDLESKKKIKYIEKELKKYGVRVEYENFNSMLCQAILARGDTSLSYYLDRANNYSKFLSLIKKDNLLEKYLNPKELVWKNIILK
ncbi:B12-binding domain-containing radical SAM protein [Methanocaldococcus indicus]|uniref:B12-binding domain-containing radical SAM protein n=1 Tax=Methanocaldococcus indicus TaxID=213231 RepID=UPI003C6D2F4E